MRKVCKFLPQLGTMTWFIPSHPTRRLKALGVVQVISFGISGFRPLIALNS